MTKVKKSAIEVRTVIGEITRFGDGFPEPQKFFNEDGTETSVLFFDIRSNGAIFKVQLRGHRTLEAFQTGEFYHPIEEQWFQMSPLGLGDWVKVTGSFTVKPPTEKFDREQNVLTAWEPWNIRKSQQVARPPKKKMATW